MIREPSGEEATMNVYLKSGAQYSNVDFPQFVNDESKFLVFWDEVDENKMIVIPMEQVNYFEYVLEEVDGD